jgi:hypothetical protein
MARAENLDAGKPAPALFAATCTACHASPKGLVKDRSGMGLVSFLRQHYTASPESANALAAYLTANVGDPRAKPAEAAPAAKRRPGQAAEPPAAKTEPPARPPHQTATARPDSMIEPVDPRRRPEEAKGAGRNKRQPTKQETTAAPPQPAGETPAAPPPPAAPVAAAPPPDQPAFSAPSP